MIPSSVESRPQRPERGPAKPLIDPRDGDAEDDASSPKQKSLMAIAGSLLAEISLTKLLLVWAASIVFPAAILGFAPLVATAWVGDVFSRLLELYGIGAAIVLLAVAGAGWIGWRPLLRAAEANFWALNALGVQPGYALCREASWRHSSRVQPRPPKIGLCGGTRSCFVDLPCPLPWRWG